MSNPYYVSPKAAQYNSAQDEKRAKLVKEIVGLLGTTDAGVMAVLRALKAKADAYDKWAAEAADGKR